jgi:hypothetical protein
VSKDIAELCRKIYQKHRRALDLIFKHASSQLSEISSFIQQLIEDTDNLTLDDSNPTLIRFSDNSWDELGLFAEEIGWTKSKRILLFEFNNEFKNSMGRLRLKLIIGPGPLEIRQKLLDMAQADNLFKTPSRRLNNKWNQIFEIVFVKSYADLEFEDIKNEIRNSWRDFIANQLPKIRESVRAACVR